MSETYRSRQYKENLVAVDKLHPQMSYNGINLTPVLFIIIEPRHEKTCLCHMRTTKVQISLRIRAVWSASLFSLPR